MRINESTIRRIISEELNEGILDATSGSTRPAPVPSDTRSASRSQDLANAKRMADTAAKKLSPAVGPKKSEVSKMSVDDLKGYVKGYGQDGDNKKKAADPDEMKKAAAAVLNLSKRDAQGSNEMLSNLKGNPTLRGAVLTTPGMTDMQTAVDMNLRAAGRDPRTAIGDSWRELGKMTSKYNLAEGKLQRIIREELTLLREMSEIPERSEVELLEIDGRMVARMLRDGGETLISSLILNPDLPGANDYLWRHVLRKGKELGRTWRVEFPVDRVGYRGMSLRDMGYSDGELQVIIGVRVGDPAIRDYSEHLLHLLKIDINFNVTDRYGKRMELGELRPGGYKNVRKHTGYPLPIDTNLRSCTFSPTGVSIDDLEDLAFSRGMYISV